MPKGQRETKSERKLRKERLPVSWRLTNPPSLMRRCEFPNPDILLTRASALRKELSLLAEYTMASANKRTQQLAVIPLDDCPFEFIQKEVGGFDDVLRFGFFFSFREISSLLRQQTFQRPTFIPIITHRKFDEFRMAVIKVTDNKNGRSIRLCFQEEVSDITSCGGELIARPLEHLMRREW
jgi:hypothetical protein